MRRARNAGVGLPPHIRERALSRIAIADGCWEWTGSRQVTNMGHGQMWNGEATVTAHRLVYEMLVGPIPAELVIDHLCRNPACVNPAHMEPVTQKENQNRGKAADHWRDKTHCPQGHPYDDENTYLHPSGSRICRECSRARRRAWYAKRKAAST